MYLKGEQEKWQCTTNLRKANQRHISLCDCNAKGGFGFSAGTDFTGISELNDVVFLINCYIYSSAISMGTEVLLSPPLHTEKRIVWRFTQCSHKALNMKSPRSCSALLPRASPNCGMLLCGKQNIHIHKHWQSSVLVRATHLSDRGVCSSSWPANTPKLSKSCFLSPNETH